MMADVRTVAVMQALAINKKQAMVLAVDELFVDWDHKSFCLVFSGLLFYFVVPNSN
jgi:hypothetical protein